MQRFDERDTIFSRMELAPGSEEYTDYYQRRPELRAVDDELRSFGPGVFSSHQLDAALVDSTFSLIEALRPLSDGRPAPERPEVGPEELPERLTTLAAGYGAVESGVASMEPHFYYSVAGRSTRYGQAIEPLDPFGFVFALPMDAEAVERAPAMPEAVEVVRRYAQVALCGLVVAFYLRRLGYAATAHIDGKSRVIMPPVAEAAGLGEVGRINFLVTKRHGPRVRLGVVTTNAPLRADTPKAFGLREVCRRCRRCAEVCPSQAISRQAEPDADGRWALDAEACFQVWRQLGTDCGVCMASCPIARKPSSEAAEPGSPGFLKSLLFGGSSS